MKALLPPSNTSGFSLIELLAVMAIVGMLAMASVPAVNSLNGGRTLAYQASEIQGVLESARTHAMAKNTYVFVGLAETDGSRSDTASPVSGTGRVAVMVMGSKDGTRSFGTGNSNLVALSKLKKLDNVHLTDSLPQSGGLSRPSVAADNCVGASGFQSESSFSANSYVFSKIIQFDPSGAASVQSTDSKTPQWMEVALVETKGTQILDSSSRSAALVLDGVTGSVKVYRP